MLSFWETKYFTSFDAIVIGSGIVGLSSAYYLKKKYPTWRIAILERGLLPSGASTKNAGFACMGSPTELLDDLQHSSEEEVVQLFLLRKKGLERLQSILGHEAMGYKPSGSYELLFENDLYALDKLDYLNHLLEKELHQPAFSMCSEHIARFGFDTNTVKGLLENKLEAEIDTGKTMLHFLQLLRSMDIEYYTGTSVLTLEEENQKVIVRCSDGLKQELSLHANHVLICTNAFAKTLLPEYDVTPGRGQVLITNPIETLSFKGIFHFNQGYYYFREYEGRVLFGGGRNLDKQTEETTAFELNERIQQDLENKLRDFILPGVAFTVAQRWTGIMAFGENKTPIVKKHSERVWVGVRMGGMGVAIGSEVGYALASMIPN